MHISRRGFLKFSAAFFVSGCGVLLRPFSATAADWNKDGFSARNLGDVIKNLNAGTPTSSQNIQLKIPDIADEENRVPVFVASKIPNTQSISLIVENNIHPLAASFSFSSGADPQFSTLLKIRRTSPVKVIVKASDQYYWFTKEVKIATAESAGKHR